MIRIELQDNEFGTHRRAVLVRVEVAPDGPHPMDLRQWVVSRLGAMVDIMRRMVGEKESGADMAAALSPLKAKTQGETLARLSGMCAGQGDGVTEADLDLLEDLLCWLNRVLPDPADQYLVLAWARGDGVVSLAMQSECSHPSMSRRLARLMGVLEKSFSTT